MRLTDRELAGVAIVLPQLVVVVLGLLNRRKLGQVHDEVTTDVGDCSIGELTSETARDIAALAVTVGRHLGDPTAHSRSRRADDVGRR